MMHPQVLSANAEAPLNIECLMEDVDVRSSLTREALEGMLGPFVERFEAVLRAALESSGACVCCVGALVGGRG